MKTNFMKTNSAAGPATDDPLNRAVSRHSSPVTRHAFTLIELLVVISIMAIVAALTLTVIPRVKRLQYLKNARGEMEQLALALDNYKAKYNVYPPSNPYLDPGINTLYYELSGVKTDAGGNFVTLDGACTISPSDYDQAFKTTSPAGSIGGIINCSKGSVEEGNVAKSFLPSLLPNRRGTSAAGGGVMITNLITSVRGPDPAYMPLGVPDVNPFRYVYPGTNNPGSYDLWIDLRISGKTNRICNWKSAPFIL